MSMLDRLALEHTENQFRHANVSPSVRREADAMQQASREYQEGMNNLDANLRAVDANQELSETGRAARRAETINAWAETTERNLSALETRAARLVPNAALQIAPPPLHTDPVLAQTRLAAAERHAQMILENVLIGQLLDRMADHAASEAYPDVAYLLSATPFGRMYLEARGARGEAADVWEERRLETLRPRLSETGRRALDDLPSLRDLARLPTNLRGVFNADRSRYGVR